MRRNCLLVWAVVVCLLCGLGLQAQQSDSSGSNGTSASDNANLSPSSLPAGAVPRLIRFTGAVKDRTGKVPTGVVGLTFSLYEQSEGGSPLWTETQSLTLDALGHYSALLGANSSEGLPLELFTSSKALWLGVQPQLPGEAEQPRVLLVAVPYALKSSDADTLGGLPASAYMLAPNTNPVEAIIVPPPITVPPPTVGAPSGSPITGGGTLGFVPVYTGPSTIGNSPFFNLGPNVGIGTTSPAATLDVNGTGNFSGTLTAAGVMLPATGAATSAQGFNSNPLDLTTSAFNSGTGTAVPQMFRWVAKPTGNNTATPSGTLNLQYLSGTGVPTETGLSIGSNGQIKFVSGQTFGSGGGTITGVIAGTDLTGGGVSGTVILNLDTTKVPTLAAAANNFTGTINAAAGIFSGPNSPVVSGTNTGNGSFGQLGALFNGLATGVIGSGAAYGVTGSSTNNNGVGVYGFAPSVGMASTGVYGSGDNGVYGVSATPGAFSGVYGKSAGAGGYGVDGVSTGAGGYGVYGLSNAANGTGVYGNGPTNGVYGTSAAGNGVYGASTAMNFAGVYGSSTNGNGVYGTSGAAGGAGVYGSSPGGNGVYGTTNASGLAGVYGNSSAGNGVYGVSAAAGFAGISSTNSAGYGVYGNSSGTGGSGVYGISSTGNGVYGTTGASGSAGVYGSNSGNNAIGELATSYSSSAVGVYGLSSTGNGYGVYGSSSASVGGIGVKATTVAGSGGYAVHATGDIAVHAYSNGSGGIGVDASSAPGQAGWGVSATGDTAVYAYSNGVEGAGVVAESAAGKGGKGVNASGDTGLYATTTATSYGSAVYATGPYGTNSIGVFAQGDTAVQATSAPTSGIGGTGVEAGSGGSNGSAVLATSTGANGHGVSATSTGANGIAVSAASSPGMGGSGVDASGDTGVIATGTGATGYGVYAGGYWGVYGQSTQEACTSGVCPPAAAGVVGVGNNLAIFASGDFAASGTKSAVVALPDNRVVELYAVESPENWFEDFGSTELRDGVADVALDPAFALTVNTGNAYHVFLTPNGDCKGLYIVQKTATSFQVRELQGGKSNISFDYRIVAKRRGYESVRMDELQSNAETAQAIRNVALSRPARRTLIFPKPPKTPQISEEPPRVVAPPAIRAVVPPNPPEPPRLAAPPAPREPISPKALEPPRPPEPPRFIAPPTAHPPISRKLTTPKTGGAPAAPAAVPPKPPEPEQPASPKPRQE